MLKKVNHIGMAVKDIEKAMEFWRRAFGVETPAAFIRSDLRICMINLGGVLVELLAPLDGQGVMAKHIEKHGEGIHHICYEVEDIHAAVEELESKGIALVNKEPIEGVEGKFVFLHPKATHGVLTEIVQVR